ncbi:phage tail protein [Pseudomonas sp. B2M1-30]|uniref:phage tail protein n=1 Tax=Pseudomonas TaxID=286 RepID=UPI0021C65780|nr:MULTISPECIES: phage tail protein [Pseudomonas]MCU0121316.1 phage tail protein [Pseudomonas sp. B2M1-30]MCU7261169.1 phage tail protein [Pseudomonas koreensis]
MIDANSKFFAILTDVGAAKLANANVLGVPWNITEMGVGDANDTDPQPSAKQTKLINEWRRRPLNQLRLDPVNAAVIVAEQVIPADEGGRWIREVGLYDADGDLVAVANCAPTYKPVLSQGSGRTQVVRMNLIVSSTAQIALKIDPAVVLATREYVDSRILEELAKLDVKQSVRAATTANVALVGLQTIDGVALVAGERVLVKNQAAAKENGPYVVALGAWTRAKDADSNVKVTPNLTMAVESGTTQADTIWQLVTDGPIVVGTTALTFKDITDGFARLLSPSFAGNPTAPMASQFDNSKSLATTEFLRRRGVEFSGFTTPTASLVMAAAHVGGVHSFYSAAALTATLPPLAGIPVGASVTLVCAGSGGLSVVPSAGDAVTSVNGGFGIIPLAIGDTAEFIRTSDQWRLIGGTLVLRYAGVMTGENFQTRPQFDISKALATTEFVQRSLGSYAGSTIYTGSTSTMTSADVGKLTVVNGTTATLVLPDAGTCPVGSLLPVLASTTVGLTVQAKGSQTLLTLSGLTGPIALQPSSMAVFRRLNDGTGWVLEGGDSALKYSPLFVASSGGVAGFSKSPNGRIDQWGQGTTDANGNVYVSFQTAFPNGVRSIMLLHSGGQPVMGCVVAESITKAGCTLKIAQPASVQPSWSVYWLAIGF